MVSVSMSDLKSQILTCLYNYELKRYRAPSVKEIIEHLNLRPSRAKDIRESIRYLIKDGLVEKTIKGRIRSIGYRLTNDGKVFARTIMETWKSIDLGSYVVERLGGVEPGRTIIIDRKRSKFFVKASAQEKKEVEKFSNYVSRRYKDLLCEKIENSKPKGIEQEIIYTYATIGTQSIFFTTALSTSLKLDQKINLTIMVKNSTDEILKSILNEKCDIFPVMPWQTLVESYDEIRGNDSIVIIPWGFSCTRSEIVQGTEIHWVKEDNEMYYYPSAQRTDNIQKFKKLYDIKTYEVDEYELDPKTSLMVALERQVAELRNKSEEMEIKSEEFSTHDPLYITMTKRFFDVLSYTDLEKMRWLPWKIARNKRIKGGRTYQHILYEAALKSLKKNTAKNLRRINRK